MLDCGDGEMVVHCPICVRHVSRLMCSQCLVSEFPLCSSYCSIKTSLTEQNVKLGGDIELSIEKQEHFGLWELVSQRSISLQSLKLRLLAKKAQINNKKSELTKTAAFVGKVRKSAGDLQSNFEIYNEHRENRSLKVKNKCNSLAAKQESLKRIRLSLVENTMKYLVTLKPACFINPNEEPRSRVSLSIVEGLHEAVRTQQQGNRWFLADSSNDPHPGQCFNVAGCRLMDYSMYSNVRAWLENPSRPLPANDVRACAAGFAHLYILTLSLCTIFDAVWIPFSMSCCNPLNVVRLDVDQLDTCVLMLNTNIAVLCLGLGLPIEAGIQLNRPACNLYTLRNNIDCVTSGPVDLPRKIWDELRDLSGKVSWREPRVAGGRSYVTGVEDWEHVTNALPQTIMPASGWTELLSSASSSFANIFINN